MAAAKKSATKSAPKSTPKVAKAEPSWSEAPAPTANAPASSQSDDKTLALLAHLLGIFTGFIGALVIYLVKKDSSPFVERHSREALNFQITVLIASVAAAILWIIIIGIFLSVAVWVVNIIFCIMATMAASKGQEYRYPFTLRLIKGPNGSP
ncbi:MAG: DUF4870 domain-containing protein [Candidatus Thermoplasmatota archaeon]